MIGRAAALAALVIAAGCFAAGISLPIVEFRRFFFFGESYSILSMISALFQRGEVLLAGVIALFAVALPAVKLVFLGWCVIARPTGRASRRMTAVLDLLGKWSMLDVLLVAFAIVSVTASGMASARTLPGLPYFATAVVATMILTQIVRRRRRR